MSDVSTGPERRANMKQYLICVVVVCGRRRRRRFHIHISALAELFLSYPHYTTHNSRGRACLAGLTRYVYRIERDHFHIDAIVCVQRLPTTNSISAMRCDGMTGMTK